MMAGMMLLIASEASLHYSPGCRFSGHLEILLLDELVGHFN